MPTRYKVTLTLEKQFNDMNKKLIDTLNMQKYLCMTCDMWSSRANSYLGMTVHYINPQTFQRHSYILAFRQFHGKQTYAELAKVIFNIFNEYGLKSERITNIVTDGGSNFGKMFKHFGKPIDEVAIDCVDVSNDDDSENGDNCENEDEAEAQFMVDVNGDVYVNEVLQLNKLNTAKDNTDAISDDGLDAYLAASVTQTTLPTTQMLPAQRRCMSHLLNLSQKDFEKKYLTGSANIRLCHALGKLQTLWVLTHRSSRAKDFCKKIIGRCLEIPNDTRWNSRPDAVNVIMHADVKENVNKLIEELKSNLNCPSAKNLQTLTTGDFIVLSVYLKVLDPVAKSLDLLQRENSCSQGYILPVLKSMKHRIETIEESTLIVKDFKKAMLESIHNRFSGYFAFNASNKDLLLASMSEPKIKTNFIENDDDLIYSKNILVAECKRMRTETLPTDEQVQTAPIVDATNNFLISFAQNRVRRDSLENQIESEVSRFLADVRTDTSILKEFPTVREVYFKFILSFYIAIVSTGGTNF